LDEKIENCKNYVIPEQTVADTVAYPLKAVGSIIPKTSWSRMDPDRSGWISKKDPSRARASPTGRKHFYSRICTVFVSSYNFR